MPSGPVAYDKPRVANKAVTYKGSFRVLVARGPRGSGTSASRRESSPTCRPSSRGPVLRPWFRWQSARESRRLSQDGSSGRGRMSPRSPRAKAAVSSSEGPRAPRRVGTVARLRGGTRCSDTGAGACSRSADGGEKEKGSGKKRRRSAYFVHFGGRLDGARVDLLTEQRLRLHARDHEEHPGRVVQVVLDGAAPDDPRLRVDLLAHDLRGLLGLGHRQVGSADDAHERAAGVGQVDFAEQWGLERLVDRVIDPVPLFLALADPDHRDATALHDRHEVGVVEVDESRLRDDLRHALDRLHEDLVRDLERRVDWKTGHELEELVVVDDDRRVAELAQPVQAGLRVLHADSALGLERHRDHAHREGAFLFRDPRDVLRRAGPGPAAHARRDEHDMGPPEKLPDLLFVLVSRLLPDLGEGAGAEPLREALPDEDLLRRVDGQQVLRIRVHRGELRARDPGFTAPVDRVRSAAAAADDLDRDVDRFDDLLDLFIVAGLLVDGLRLRGFALFLCFGFLVSGQSLVEKRFHCAIPSRRRLTAGRIHLALFKSSHTYVRQTLR